MVPEVSIVSGTYNRLGYLKRMVASVRSSIGSDIPYEIIMVDGGSTDGTVKWCEDQKDIVLIQHGALLGAVRAFNDGAYAARGSYVILANDDVEFIEYSIMRAVVFMQDNPSVGIGCFYQDRDGKQWHVDQMPAIVNGVQTSVYYGQVCIVLKWLGDKVGWWGNYLRTYGGDNELSCNVLEYGYKVVPIECACIHDTKPDDELRHVNNGEKLANGNHPDSHAWISKWRHKVDGKLGPDVTDIPHSLNTVKRMYRILYAPIYEPGWKIQRIMKRGLRLALEKYGTVVECDYMSNIYDMFDMADAFNPDIFVLQIQSIGEFTPDIVMELKRLCPTAKYVCWNGDYHPENLYNQQYMDMLKLFDLTGLVTTEVAGRYNVAGIKWFYWQIGYEEPIEDYHSFPDGVPAYDIVFLANKYSSDRLNLVDSIITKFGAKNVGLYGNGWPNGWAKGSTLYDFNSGDALYKRCKIAVSDSQWPRATGFVSNRLFQAMSSGAFLMQQRFDGMGRLLGMQDGIHLVVWDTFEDFVDKVMYYLNHESDRKRIADVGCQFVRMRHSFDARVVELLDELYG